MNEQEQLQNKENGFISIKKIVVMAVIVLVLFALAIVAIFLFAPDAMPVDWSKVRKIPTKVTLLAAEDDRNPTDTHALVKLNEDGSVDASDWNVLQFTDIHLTQDDERNEVSLNLLIDTLNREKPDFVVLTGDIITRPRGRARAIQLAQIFERMGIYWSYCLDNHEGDSMPYTLSREENIRIWSEYDHCLLDNDVKKTSDGTPVWGLGNTVVNLLGADYNVVQSMIFMDSGSKLTDESVAELKEKGVEDIDKSSYDFLKSSQMTWYEEQVRAVTDDLTNGVKTMLFIHIPLAEQANVKLIKYTDVLEEDWYYAYPEKPLMIGEETYGYTVVKKGWKLAGGTESYEKCYCSDYNMGMYDLMKSLRAGVNAMFCGHDHISNSILYEEDIALDDPVYLCYGICSGLQSYNMYSMGLSDTDDYSLRGYATITVHADSTFDYHQVRYNDIEHPAACIVGGVACD